MIKDIIYILSLAYDNYNLSLLPSAVSLYALVWDLREWYSLGQAHAGHVSCFAYLLASEVEEHSH